MRKTKLGAVMASLALAAGTTAVFAAPPADAVTSTTATLSLSGHKHVKGTYGEFIGLFEGSVKDSSGNEVASGTADLQRKLPGHGWKTIKSDTSAGFLFFGNTGSHATGNAAYRVHYLGDSTYAASFSNVVTVGTFWNLHDSGSCVGGCHLTGRLAPATKNHQVLIQVKHGTWKRYKVVRTNKKSRFRAAVTPSRGQGTRYRIVVGANRHILKTTSRVYRAVRF
jgi:hypothetical protein